MIDNLKIKLIITYYKLKAYFTNTIYLYWYRYEEDLKDKGENFGDMIGLILFNKLTNKKIKHIDDFKPFKYKKYVNFYLTVGSILYKANSNSIVWGSGIIDSNQNVSPGATYLSVRGPRTRALLLNLGNECPDNFGDPAILLPLFYKKNKIKDTDITIIPHYVDYDLVNVESNNKVDKINLITNDFELTLNEIIASKLIISSSLHGLIIAIAYGIPCYWVRFSENLSGDDVKFYDFFESLGINNVKFHNINDIDKFIGNINKFDPIILNDKNILNQLQNKLLSTFPFN